MDDGMTGGEGGSRLDAGDAREPSRAPRRRRLRLWVWGALLVLIVPLLAWLAAAAFAIRGFDGYYAACDGGSWLSPEFEVGPIEASDDLAEVAKAFERFYAQDSWSYAVVYDDGHEDIRFTKDGSLMERRHGDDDFVGLIREGRGIAKTHGSRFWLPFCVNGPMILSGHMTTDCVETESEGGMVETTWASSSDGTCDPESASFSATVIDGRLTAWTETFGGSTTLNRVEEPRDLRWPSPVWIVPTWLARPPEH